MPQLGSTDVCSTSRKTYGHSQPSDLGGKSLATEHRGVCWFGWVFPALGYFAAQPAAAEGPQDSGLFGAHRRALGHPDASAAVTRSARAGFRSLAHAHRRVPAAALPHQPRSVTSRPPTRAGGLAGRHSPVTARSPQGCHQALRTSPIPAGKWGERAFTSARRRQPGPHTASLAAPQDRGPRPPQLRGLPRSAAATRRHPRTQPGSPPSPTPAAKSQLGTCKARLWHPTVPRFSVTQSPPSLGHRRRAGRNTELAGNALPARAGTAKGKRETRAEGGGGLKSPSFPSPKPPGKSPAGFRHAHPYAPLCQQ